MTAETPTPDVRSWPTTWFMVRGWTSAHLPGRRQGWTLCGREVRGEIAAEMRVPRCGQCVRRWDARRSRV